MHSRTYPVLLLALTLPHGCSYDWNVGSGDAGGGTQLSPLCQRIVEDLDELRPTATACVVPGLECDYETTDECGCPLGGSVNPLNVDAYTDLVEEFNEAECEIDCPACVQSHTPVCKSTGDGNHCE